jgi:hypothetical protein
LTVVPFDIEERSARLIVGESRLFQSASKAAGIVAKGEKKEEEKEEKVKTEVIARAEVIQGYRRKWMNYS